MKIINDITSFLLPRFCVMCNSRLVGNEKHICIDCLRQLQRTHSHLVDGNPIEKIFWYHTPIEKAVSWFFYEGENTRHILYELKYHNKPNIGKYLASIMAEEIKSTDYFDGIDIIVPVPLHWKRRLKRGYNQSYYIAKGISEVTGIPVNTNIIKRTVNNPTQTHLTHSERQNNVNGIFKVRKPELIEGKHILLVDDVITTGATTIECAKSMMKAQGVRFSVISLAYAGQHFYINPDNPSEYNQLA